MIVHWLNWFCLRGAGYQFWSGIGGDVFLLSPLVLLYHHLNCHEDGCWRLGHTDPEHHRPACRRHHSRA